MATINALGNGLSLTTGTNNFTGSTSASFVTPIIGAANATSINFGGTSLGNYVQGTWTPTLTFTTVGNLSVSYSTQTGTYTRIGNIVFLDFTLVCTPTFTTSSGTLRIAGLPLNPASSGVYGIIGSQGTNPSYPAGATNTVMGTSAGASFLSIGALGSAKASAAISSTQVTSGSVVSLSASIVYNI